MLRYPAILWVLIKTSAQNELAYRVNALFTLFFTLIGVGTGLAAVYVVYGHTDTIKGWTLAQTLALYGVYTLMNGLISTFIAPNLDEFSEGIRKGTLDFALLKPASSQFLVSFGKCRIWGMADLLLGAGIVAYALSLGMGEGVGPPQVAAFLVAGASGAVIMYGLWMSLATVAFWTVKIDNISTILHSFFNMGRFPVDAYPTWLRRTLTFVLPVAFVTTVPIEALRSEGAPLALVASVLVAAGMLWVSTRLWRFGLSRYTSASS